MGRLRRQAFHCLRVRRVICASHATRGLGTLRNPLALSARFQVAITHASFTTASLAMTLLLGRSRASNEFANPAFGGGRSRALHIQITLIASAPSLRSISIWVVLRFASRWGTNISQAEPTMSRSMQGSGTLVLRGMRELVAMEARPFTSRPLAGADLPIRSLEGAW